MIIGDTTDTRVALDEHFSMRLEAMEKFFEAERRNLEKLFDARLAGTALASELAATALKERLTHMNNLREQMREREAISITRAEFNLAHNTLVDRVDRLDRLATIAQAKASYGAVWVSTGIAVIGFVMAVVSFVWRLRP